jgi:hypothetical protein
LILLLQADANDIDLDQRSDQPMKNNPHWPRRTYLSHPKYQTDLKKYRFVQNLK